MPSQLEALLQQARSALADSNSSLLNNRYPVYPGQTRPEMSALTARKRQIEDNYRLKRPSYTKAIQHATHRATGFKEGDVQSLLDRIQAQQQNLGGYGIQRIKNIFGNAYSGNLQDKINKDTLAKNTQSRVGFDNLANEARSIDTRDNTKTLQTLNALSLSKNATKEGVLGLLEQLGNQKHAYDQAKFNADRAMFNRQANYPYSRSQGLGDAISGGITIADAVRRDRMNAEQGGEFNPLSPTPSEERYAENRLRRGMNNLNTAYPVYPGKLIADLTPDMKLSYNLAERLEPNIQDNSYEERRNLRKRLTDGDITSQKALASLDEKASPLEQNLNKDVQRAIKQVTAKINASRVMSGTFGSKSHQSELDAAIRDIVSGKYGNRANITTDTLSRSLQDLSRENDVTNERVRELDRTGTREITDALNQIRNINQRGATQWGNEQNTLNQQFQQFSDEADWENNNRGNLGSNPQNRGLAIAGGIERASSQSPLVLPQALHFNNLQANIPFEESKVAAPTTDPRIQRTSQLFNDEEEMRRIAEAARERQNREELARQQEKYGNLPRELIDFIIDLKNKRKQKRLQNGATIREVPAMSHYFSSVLDKTRPRPDLQWGSIESDERFRFARNFHDDQLPRKSRKLFDEMLSRPEERLDFLKRFYPEAKDYNGKRYDYNRDFSNFLAYRARPNDSSLWRPGSIEQENIQNIFYNFINQKLGGYEGVNGQGEVVYNKNLGKKLNADFFEDPEIFDLFTNWSGLHGASGRRPLNRTKQKLLTDNEYNEYMRKFEEEKRRYEEKVRDLRLRPSLAMRSKTEAMNARMEREAIEAAERERWARIAQQQAEARRAREAAEQQAEAARRAQQQQQLQSEGARRMQVYRDLIANIPDTSIYPFDAINYAMTGQTSLPTNLSSNQRASLLTGTLHPNNISHFNYLSQHNPSFNLAQELEYLKNLARNRIDSVARAQAQMLNDAVRNYRR